MEKLNVSTASSLASWRLGVRLFSVFVTSFFLLCSCPARAQDAFPKETVKAFSDAGLRLLSQKVSPRDFSLPVVSPPGTGENLSISALKGKVVFLNFWATWCGPCRSEMPSMESLYNLYKEKGLEILAVNNGEEQEQVLAFLRNNGLSFTAVLDADSKVSASYGIQAIPTSFLIDREGKIIARIVGSLNWDTPKIRNAIEQLSK